MIRTLFEIPIPFSGTTIPIYAYGFMLMVGFLVTIYVARKKAKAEGLDPEIISNMGLYTVFAGTPATTTPGGTSLLTREQAAYVEYIDFGNFVGTTYRYVVAIFCDGTVTAEQMYLSVGQGSPSS